LEWQIYAGVKFNELSLSGINHSMWIVISFLACQAGAIMPDYDIIWKKIMPHRFLLTHSIILPGILCIPLVTVEERTTFLVPVYAFFLIGYSSHLLGDLMPKAWMGSALISIPWKNKEGKKKMPPKVSFLFLLMNGLILLGAAVVIMFFFEKWIR